MIEEEDVNKRTLNYSFKGNHIYSLKDYLLKYLKEILDRPLKEKIIVNHNAYNKKA